MLVGGGAVTINYRRGFLRVWALISVLWIAGAVTLSASHMQKDTEEWNFRRLIDKAILMMPVLCSEVRGERGAELEKGICYFEEPKFRTLYPEYADLNRDELAKRLYSRVGKTYTPTPTLFGVLGSYLIFIFTPPLALLLMGAAFVWVRAGFLRG